MWVIKICGSSRPIKKILALVKNKTKTKANKNTNKLANPSKFAAVNMTEWKKNLHYTVDFKLFTQKNLISPYNLAV